jgi:hypothetical protein
LLSLVSHPDGAAVFTAIDDLSPLTEIAPSQPLVLDTLLHAWVNAMTATPDKAKLRSKIDSTISSLVSSFKGTDAVTLLSFLATLLPRLEPEVSHPFPLSPDNNISPHHADLTTRSYHQAPNGSPPS